MSRASEIRSRTNAYAGQLLIAAIIILYAIVMIFSLRNFENLRTPTLYLIPIVLIYLNVLALIILRQGEGKIPTLRLVGGVVVIAGGTIFDMLATVIKSPELSLEGNIIARMMLDSGQSVQFVYGYAIITQFLLIAVMSIVWAAFLRHKETLLEVIWESQPTSRSEFIKAALGGEGYSWKGYFTFHKFSSPYYRRVMYHSLLFMGALFPTLSLYRWWLGLEWFQIVPNLSDGILIVGCILLGVVVYITWLLREYAAGREGQSSVSQTA
jgi:hypothetical protein